MKKTTLHPIILNMTTEMDMELLGTWLQYRKQDKYREFWIGSRTRIPNDILVDMNDGDSVTLQRLTYYHDINGVSCGGLYDEAHQIDTNKLSNQYDGCASVSPLTLTRRGKNLIVSEI